MTQPNDSQLRTAAGALSETTVLFGHQSVGRNILSGIEELGVMDVAIADVTDGPVPPLPGGGSIFHAYVGRNLHPDEKISDFERLVRSDLGRTADIAFLKLCYVDVESQMPVETIFAEYVAAVEQLEEDFPETTFVYLTMPLMAKRGGVKDLVKHVLGRETPGREGNVARGRFNELLRESKGETGRLFDIAAIESTHPDGAPERVTVQGTTVEALVPAYTSDGGHLNALGRRTVARELVVFLGELARD